MLPIDGVRRVRNKSKAVRIVIQRDIGDRSWSEINGWVEPQSAATVCPGMVAGLDACVNHRLGGADILMSFGMPELDLRLRTNRQR